MKRFAYTMAEIVIAIVVMAVVVAVTVPITKDKLKKVDYATYYLGYRVAQTIASEMLQDALKDYDENVPVCIPETGTCYTKPKEVSSLEPHVWNACKSDGTSDDPVDIAYMNKIGISTCSYSYSDSLAAAMEMCGGKNNMISNEKLSVLATYAYDKDISIKSQGLALPNSGLNYNDTNKPLLRDLELLGKYILLNTDSGGDVTFSSIFGQFELNSDTTSRNPSNRVVICTGANLTSSKPAANYLQSHMTKKFSANKGADTSEETVAAVQNAAVGSDFSALTPDVTLPNGVRVYIGSNLGEIDLLNDSVDEDDREGFIVYIDIDGSNSRSKLYEDVYPFYLLRSGKVVPGYSSTTKAGANSETHLAFNLTADIFIEETETEDAKRLIKSLTPKALTDTDSDSFKSVACSAGYVTSTKYCGVDPTKISLSTGLAEPSSITCYGNENIDCRMKVRTPIRILN